MDTILFHPKLVHLPIALAMIMPLLTLSLTLAWWRRWLPARAWVLAVGLQALLVGSGFAALRSGEAEEDRVEALVPEAALEAHEESAEAFVGASAVAFVLMLGVLPLTRRRLGLVAASAAMVASLAVLGLGYQTGQAGGELVYRYGAAQGHVIANAPGRAPPTATSFHDHYEEDDD